MFKELLLLLQLFLLSRAAENPVVTLDYGKFQGKYDNRYNIAYFRKIPFGASTAGANRFRAPQPPPIIAENEVYDTDQDFDMCPQREDSGSEDCLYLGIYSRPWDTKAPPKRPVLVVFFGGGFIRGSASFTLPPFAYPILNVNTANDFVVVYPNYRTNAFGFLPGRRVKDSPTADLNAGLLDQNFALEWVQKHIARFGGDPDDMIIWGQSAGAGSVVAQVAAQAQQQKPGPKLFHRALASSPFWPKTYRYDEPEAEALYDQLVSLAGCAGQTGDSLECLRAVDVQKLREAALQISAANTYTTSSFNWAPVIDGDFLRAPLSSLAATAPGTTMWTMYNTHEGENFLPDSLSRSSRDKDDPALDSWLRGYLPRFDDAKIAAVKALYPLDGQAENVVLDSTRVRAGLIFRDSVLACPGLWAAQAAQASQGGKAFLGEYTISPAKHDDDAIYWNQVNEIQQTDPFIYQGYTGAFGSFFQTGDPNAQGPPPQTGATKKPYAAVPPLQSGQEWVTKSDSFETHDVAMLTKRCAFWKDNAESVPL
ncbi:putative carboxylesterase [Phyllosticta citricarpa]|uniref:Carboxylic ester hydrolase n=2 Tax=Phyllosticta TaxID=121621 RepID=A0ABR1MR49_9PEZI